MKFEECTKFANENPTAYVATVDEKGQPRVRALAMWYADKTGFYFQTGTVKEMVGQIKRTRRWKFAFLIINVKVELCCG